MLSDERGFTLVEVMVAALMLVASVLATLALLDNATTTTAAGKQTDVANGIAQEMIERAAGGRYTSVRNDLTDVDTASATPGPADRMRAGMDPDGDQASTAVAPTTVTSGSLPINAAQSWTLKRKSTTYTVSYRACTGSDIYQQVQIQGTFDCNRSSTNPPAGDQTTDAASGCSLGVIPATGVDPSNPGQLTVKLQVLGIVGISACVGAISTPLSNALCTLLGNSPALAALTSSLLGANGLLTNLLGGLAGGSVGLCPVSQVEQLGGGARDGIGSSTRLAVTVGWTDVGGHARSISQTSLIRRSAA